MRTDQDLLQMLKNGDEEVIKLIFEKYYEGLCLYAENIIKEHQPAEEIVEDIFIHLWYNCKKTTIYSSLKNYLFRSTHNNCLKYLIKQKKADRLFTGLDYLLVDKEILYPASPFHPVSDLISKELEVKAAEIMDTLPTECKKIYQLNRFENLSYSTIANKLNITVGTVKKQMSRAFNIFRKELKDYIPLIIGILLTLN